MPARLSVTGIEKYYNEGNRSLFSAIQLPVGINRNILIQNILKEAAAYETIYPDGEYLESSIRLFFRKWYRTFEKWQAALQIDYNPLENYDRSESWNSSGSSSASAGTDTTTTEKVTAYDSETLKDNSQSVLDSDSTSSGSTAGQGSSRIHGNIGVTTSQQMLEAELKVQEFNIYEKITDMFITEFCILVF